MFIERLRYFNSKKEFLFVQGMIVTTRDNYKYIYHDTLIHRGSASYDVLFHTNSNLYIFIEGYDKNFNYIGKTFCDEKANNKYDMMKIEISHNPHLLWRGLCEKDSQIETEILWERDNTRGIIGLKTW